MPLTKGSRRAIASFVMVAMVTTIVSGGQVGAVPHVSRAVASHSTTVGAGVGTGTGTRHGHGHGHGHEHEHEHGLDAGFGAGTGALNSSDHDAGPKSPSPLSLLPPSPPSFSSSSSWTGSPTLLHREACPKYIFFTARGTNEPIIDPRGSRHLTDRVMRQVPGGLVQGVPYRATRDYLLQPERGAALLVQLVTDIARACGGSGAGDAAGAGDGGNAGGNADGGDGEEEGGTKVVVYGYSEGAMVVVNALNDPSLVPYAHLIVAIVLFGNPYYQSGLPQDRGTARTGTGIGRIKDSFEPHFRVPAQFTDRTRDYCNAGDFVCRGIRRGTLATVLTPGVPAHHYDGTKEEGEAVDFIVRQLRQLRQALGE